jgi:hypothetical protein
VGARVTIGLDEQQRSHVGTLDVTVAEPAPEPGPDAPEERVEAGPPQAPVPVAARRRRFRIARPRRPDLHIRGSRGARLVRRGIALVAGGALVGFVASALTVAIVAGGSVTGRPAEPPVTRAYISAMLDRDATRLAQMQPAADLGTRAAAIQQSSGQQPWSAEAISYLGGAVDGPIGVYVYVVKVKSPDGTAQQAVPFAFTVFDKKVVRVQ